MIAVDTNILVYAHREDSEWHQAAYQRLAELAEGRAAWAIPWPCIHEFLAIVTHPKIFSPPTPLPQALDQVDAWIERRRSFFSPNRRCTGNICVACCWPVKLQGQRYTMRASQHCACSTALSNSGPPTAISDDSPL